MAFLFETVCGDMLASLLFLSVIGYVYVKHLFSYWKNRNVKFIPPTFPFGNFTNSAMQRKPMGEIVQDLYHLSTEPFVGIYGGLRPILLFRDTELVRSIFIKDFQHFSDRGVYIDEKSDPLSGHLFALNGEKWKNLRVKLTPVFTSGKLKAMFSTLLDCGNSLQKYVDNIAKNEEVVEIKEIAARYTTDVIASVAFGVDVNSIENPDTEFRRYGRKALEMNFKNGIRTAISFLAPKLQKFIKFKSVDDDVENFIMTLVKKNLEYREKNNISRKDLFQLLIQLRNTGKVQVDGQWDTEITKNESNKVLTINEMAAQTWIFYAAGFETSSSTMSFCLYELAKHQDIQQKVQEEIDDITAKHNNQITYDSISEMKYLESAIDETLRKYPILPILNRECTKEYKIPGTNVTIEKGTGIFIPVYALQHDPKYYPEPKRFKPDRFLPENKANKTFVEMPYMPFGEGPRNCIGLRLGKMQTKVGLLLLLQNYKYNLPDNAAEELLISPQSFLMSSKDGINLKISLRH